MRVPKCWQICFNIISHSSMWISMAMKLVYRG
jgi:hypothetical protein